MKKSNIIAILLTLFVLQLQGQSFQKGPTKRMGDTGLGIGSGLPASLEVYNSKGRKMKLNSLFKNKPTVIVSGCLTCPVFLRTYPNVEAVYQDFKLLINIICF